MLLRALILLQGKREDEAKQWHSGEDVSLAVAKLGLIYVTTKGPLSLPESLEPGVNSEHPLDVGPK